MERYRGELTRLGEISKQIGIPPHWLWILAGLVPSPLSLHGRIRLNDRPATWRASYIDGDHS